jgi:hypothetical protein
VFHDSQRSLRAWLRIAATSARNDVEMDRLVPDSARLSEALELLHTKHWALRLVRFIARGTVPQHCVRIGAMGAGFLLHAVRADHAAFAAFSVVRDITYCRALQQAMLAVQVESPVETAPLGATAE